MPKRNNKLDEYTQLGIRVEGYSVRSEASMNYNLKTPTLTGSDEEPVFRCVTYVEIVGTSNYPEHRANECYELAIHGDATKRISLKLRDVQKVDEYGSRQYRKYRGASLPIYDCPPGLAVLDRRRGSRGGGARVDADSAEPGLGHASSAPVAAAALRGVAGKESRSASMGGEH